MRRLLICGEANGALCPVYHHRSPKKPQGKSKGIGDGPVALPPGPRRGHPRVGGVQAALVHAGEVRSNFNYYPAGFVPRLGIGQC